MHLRKASKLACPGRWRATKPNGGMVSNGKMGSGAMNMGFGPRTTKVHGILGAKGI